MNKIIEVLKSIINVTAKLSDQKVLDVITIVCLIGAAVFFSLYKLRQKKNLKDKEYAEKVRRIKQLEQAEKERRAKEYASSFDDNAYSYDYDDTEYDSNYDEYDGSEELSESSEEPSSDDNDDFNFQYVDDDIDND